MFSVWRSYGILRRTELGVRCDLFHVSHGGGFRRSFTAGGLVTIRWNGHTRLYFTCEAMFFRPSERNSKPLDFCRVPLFALWIRWHRTYLTQSVDVLPCRYQVHSSQLPFQPKPMENRIMLSLILAWRQSWQVLRFMWVGISVRAQKICDDDDSWAL